MPASRFPYVDQLLGQWAPASVLSVGPDAPRILFGYAAANPASRITHIATDGCVSHALEVLAYQARFDFALVAGLLEQADSDGWVTLISRLRDVHARRLCVRVEAGRAADVWSHDELVALGLQPLVENGGVRFYGFDINAYKDTPDWLNAKNWANPELWGKHRW